MAVVYKPAGMPVHSQERRSLRHALGFALQAITEPDALVQFEPVHRLDARTQGLMLVAKTARSRAQLGLDFADHQSIHKVYQCLVVGELTDGESTSPSTKNRYSRWKVLAFMTLPSRRRYLVEVQIYTGRTPNPQTHVGTRNACTGRRLYTIGNPLRKRSIFGGDSDGFTIPLQAFNYVYPFPLQKSFTSVYGMNLTI